MTHRFRKQARSHKGIGYSRTTCALPGFSFLRPFRIFVRQIPLQGLPYPLFVC